MAPLYCKSMEKHKYIVVSFFSMSDERINKRVFKYALNKGSARLKNWPYRIINYLHNINCSEYSNIVTCISNISMNNQVSINMTDSYKLQWTRLVTKNQSARGTGGKKNKKLQAF